MPTLKLGDVRRGRLMAIAAAALFGASTPGAKALIGGVSQLLLASVLYLGSGVGLTALRITNKNTRRTGLITQAATPPPRF